MSESNNLTRPEAVSTASTESVHLPPSNLGTPSESPAPSGAASPLGFHIASLPGSRPASPDGYSTPGSSRPPSPLLKALNKLSMTSEKRDKEGKEGESGLGRRPSVNGGSLSRKNSLKAPLPRRGSSPALAPFLAKYDQFTGNDSGREEKVCVIGSGSWGTALARLAAQNAAEREGYEHNFSRALSTSDSAEADDCSPRRFDEEVRFWVRQREVSFVPSQAFLRARPLIRSCASVRFRARVC